jgi:O-antigen/teichoic acid export membrane protein
LTTAQQVMRALKWIAIGRLSAQLITWVITLLVMRLLTPSDYGLISLAMLITGFFALFNDLGATPALIQKREIDADLINNVYGFLIVTNSILYITVFVSTPYLANFFNLPQLVEIVRTCGATLLLGALAAIPRALLQRELRFKSISLIDFVSTITGSLITLLLAYSGFAVWSLVVGIVMKCAIETIFLLKLANFRSSPRFNFIKLGAVLSFGTKMSVTQIIWYVNVNVDGLLIGRFLGKEALGLYSVAYNLAMLPANKIMSLTNQIAFAAYSRIQDERARAVQYFQESVALGSLVFFPTCWGMSAVADDLVTVVLGPKWLPASIVLQIVAIGVPYRAFGPLIQQLLAGVGEAGVGLRNTLTAFLIFSTGMLVGIHWGLIGACISGLIAAMLTMTVNLYRSLSLLNMNYAQLLKLAFPSMFSAAVMYAAVLIVRHEMLGEFPPTMRLPMEIGIGVVVYVGSTMVFNFAAVIRLLQLIRGSL